MFKLGKVFFAGILVFMVIFMDNPAMCEQRRLEQKFEQLKKVFESDKDSPQFESFIFKVMPNLIAIDKKLDIQKNLGPGVSIEDFMIYTYGMAVRKTQTPYGSWNEQIANELLSFSGILCRLKELITFPTPEKDKDKEYEKQMSTIAPMLVDRSYDRAIKYLSLRPKFFELTKAQIQEKGYPSVGDIINLNAIGTVQIKK